MLPTSDPTPTLLDTPLGPIAVTVEGPEDAMAFVCAHGAPGSTRDFRYLAPQLVEHARVVRVDMPGCGDSPVSPAVRSVDGWAAVLVGVADALALERPVLVGHSFGSAASLHAAALAPERFGGLTLLASPGPRRHRAYSLPPAVMRQVAGAAGWPVVGRGVLALARRAYAAAGLKVKSDDAGFRSLLTVVGTLDFTVLGELARSTELPVLLAHSRDDAIVQVDIAEELAARLPDVDVHLFGEGGHFLQKHCAPAIADAMVARFLRT